MTCTGDDLDIIVLSPRAPELLRPHVYNTPLVLTAPYPLEPIVVHDDVPICTGEEYEPVVKLF